MFVPTRFSPWCSYTLYLSLLLPGNLLSSDLLKDALDGVTSVVCFFFFFIFRNNVEIWWLLHIFTYWSIVQSYILTVTRNKSLQISCVGGFGSNSYMYKINGTANINAIRAASEKGISIFTIGLPKTSTHIGLLKIYCHSNWVLFCKPGVKRFVYISAADFGLANYLLGGYYEGKVLVYFSVIWKW